MTERTQAVVLIAVPLLVVAALYLLATAALLPHAWRERTRLRELELALALMYPSAGIATLVFGIQILREPEVRGNAWLSFAAILVALGPVVFFFARWRDRALLLTGVRRAREAEQRTTARERELDAVRELADAVAQTSDPDVVARSTLDAVTRVLGVEWASLAAVSDDARTARGVVARRDAEDVEWYPGLQFDLENEPSGIASAAYEGAPLAVYDAAASAPASARLVERIGAKSVAYVPLILDGRVSAVVVVATTRERRAFTTEELALVQALAVEGELASERSRSSTALDAALDRARLIARVGDQVRSQREVAAVLDVAVRALCSALTLSRCAIRFEPPGAQFSECATAGLEAVGDAGHTLALAEIAARERRTVVVADATAAPEAEADRDALAALGTRAVLATPLVLSDAVLGTLTLHRVAPGAWTATEVAAAETVAREAALALQTAQLLEENERRVTQHSALLDAAQAVASELDVEAVLERLVAELARLVGGDAAHCYRYDRERGVLRCAAVERLPQSLVGLEFPADRGLSARAIAERRAVVATEYATLADPVPYEAYEGFAEVIVAPVIWGEDVRAVLGVASRTPRAFSEQDAEALDAFAGLAALALRNAETYEERSRQARVQRGFYRIASVLGSPLSLSETLDAVAEAAAEAVGAAFAAVLMPRETKLELRTAQDLPPDLEHALRSLPIDGESVLAAAARDGRIVAATDLEHDDRFEDDWVAVARAAGVGALLAVPVSDRSASDGAGLVLAFFRGRRTFSEDDLDVAKHLADAARGALERSGLFEAERSARALAQQLSRTGSLLATELDPAAVLDEVVAHAPALVGADACTIRVVDGDDLVVTAAGGADVAAAVGARSPATAWLSGDVAQSRAPLALSDVGGDDRLLQADAVLGLGYSAYLGVPLVGSEGVLYGVLSVYAREPRTWRDDEVEALVALAVNASAAMSNAELYQRVAIEKERSFAILANIADGIVAVDRDGKVVLWNAAAEQITGVPQEEAYGRTPEQVLQRHLAGEGAAAGNRLVSIQRGGKEVWLSLTEAVMRDPAGAVAGRIYAFRDVSSERFVEQMKSDFVSTVSQELRRPLTSIYGFAETLLRRDVVFGEEERRTFLGYIASESERLTAIVDALLNVARLDTGDLQVNLAPTDVATVVHDVVGAVAALNGHRFVVDLPPEPLAAEADAEKLRLVLGNLVDNAIKYSPGGGTVTVAARRRSDRVEVSVADEGIGIPPVEQERIFRKFYRADVRGRDGRGTGLGLFIVRGLVTAMGGRIWVTSAEGEGSSFTFELPAAQVPVSEREFERV